jgi:hypothetical protein
MTTFTWRTVSAICALALAAPAAALAQQPTLQFDRSCYTDDQNMGFTGAGYTPGGQVDLLFASDFLPRGSFTAQADAAGALTGATFVDNADQLLSEDADRATVVVTANDRARFEADQQPPESQFGFSLFTFTRWEGYSPGRYVPGKRAEVQLYGWAFAAGKVAWFLFRKGSRTVSSVKVGRLDDECGDLTARIRVPRDLRPGKYRVVLTIDRKLGDRYSWRKARVSARRPATAAAAPGLRAMSRAGVAVTSRLGGLP